MLDNLGQRLDRYSVVLTDPTFEARLKRFDPNLKLMFDQVKKRWIVLEKAYDGSGFNVLLVCEDKATKEPVPLGEWVFMTLYAWRKEYERKRGMGIDKWLNDLKNEAISQKEEIAEKASQDNVDLIKDEIIQWKKASKELQGLPVADATAGYRKI